jgi:hypothetical protein
MGWIWVSKGPREENPSPPASRRPPDKDSDVETVKNFVPSRGELGKLALELYDKGFNVIPVGPWTEEDWERRNFKRPLVKTWGYDRRAPREELEKLPMNTVGLAIVGGPENPWGDRYWLILIDVDKPSVTERSPTLRELKLKHVSWLTGPRCPKCERKDLEVLELGRRFKCTKCNFEFSINEAKRGYGLMVLVNRSVGEKLGQTLRLGDVELLVKNYQLIPPSLHPSGVAYEWINPPDPDKPFNGIRYMLEAELKALVKELGFELPIANTEKTDIEKQFGDADRPVAVRTEFRRLSEQQVKRIVELLSPYYVEGHRDRIIFSLLGLLIKAGVDRESARRVIERLAVNNNDEEAHQRLYLVDWHYGKRVVERPIEELKGVSGLREELEGVLREQGFGEDEIARRVSEVITELYTILSMNRIPHAAWLKRQGNMLKEWVYAGRQGVCVFKRRGSDSEPEMVIASTAVIKNVKRLKIIGLDVQNLYRVTLEGETRPVEGTVDEILAYIRQYYGVARGAEFAIERLVQFMAEEEESLYYSPGPWVVNGKLVYVREPGYTPDWKPWVTWSLPEDDISIELKREALESVKKFVEAYRNPGKPSLVLSYAAIASVAHFIKMVLGVAFHMLIHGSEVTGKTVLIDLLKMIYGVDWQEPYPGSDYQARRLLATSTLPALLDEFTGLGDYERNRGVKEALDVLHRAATVELLKISGGHQYAGVFLAIRVLIAATNEDISMVPWQLDKWILVKISTDEMLDLNKARGYTPRTMRRDVARALRYIGRELLEEVEKLLPEIQGMRGLSREEIRVKLVELGYKAWVNICGKHGIEPFPAPSPPETESEKEALKEQYREAFIAYVMTVKEGMMRDAKINEYREGELGGATLLDLNTHLAIIFAKKDGSRELLCRHSFATKVAKHISDVYGLPRISGSRLIELVGLRKTCRRIAEVEVCNLYYLELKLP